ncbi:MAG: hypothetical protein QNK03_18465 [Myxococcota bacterium]|nr:hypothetical protein [Myxococcota bacterium]
MTSSGIAQQRLDRATREPARSGRVRRAALRRIAVGLLGLGLVLGMAAPASADDYKRRKSGHPVRIAAYVLHPIGVLFDTILLRPAHWLVTQEPFKTIFGHEQRRYR